jgi:hypothetical protein
MTQSYKQIADQALDFWLARGAVLVIVILQIVIVNDLMIGPRWLAPTVELLLLIPLSIVTAWTQRHARKASTDEQWAFVGRQRLVLRRLAISLTAVVTMMNFGALVGLVEAILAGHAGSGRTLLLDALNIWVTNVIIFALWYWALDRGSPASKGSRPDVRNDFLFTQQQPAGESCLHPGWSPGFIDYLFLAFTNATAFSPADTFPLTVRAKLLMMAESAISFTTIALVASRAVGILN